MSDTKQDEGQGMTHAQAMASTLPAGMTMEELNAAIDARNALAAPADEFHQFMEQVNTRLARIERAMGASTDYPAYDGETVIRSPLDRLASLENFGHELITGLRQHFSGKLPLPASPKDTPPSPNTI